MKIVVLGGGISSEREVSLLTAASVCKALRKNGHQAIFIDLFTGLENFQGELDEIFDAEDGLCGNYRIDSVAPDLAEVRKKRKDQSKSRIGKDVLAVCQKADCVFLGLHGEDGEDGKIQAALDLLGVPYTGSGPLSSGIAMNKAIAKKIAQSAGILTPNWRELIIDVNNVLSFSETLPVPCVVKVINGGSSIGVVLPNTREELRTSLGEVLKWGNHVIVEEKIIGREFTVPILGNQALSPIEILPPDCIAGFDYKSKYQAGSAAAGEVCPAKISKELTERLQRIAEQVHQTLGLSVYSRSDFIVDGKENIYWLEVNTLPGMTPASLIPKAAAVAGMSYEQLCQKILDLSLSQPKN